MLTLGPRYSRLPNCSTKCASSWYASSASMGEDTIASPRYYQLGGAFFTIHVTPHSGGALHSHSLDSLDIAAASLAAPLNDAALLSLRSCLARATFVFPPASGSRATSISVVRRARASPVNVHFFSFCFGSCANCVCSDPVCEPNKIPPSTILETPVLRRI